MTFKMAKKRKKGQRKTTLPQNRGEDTRAIN